METMLEKIDRLEREISDLKGALLSQPNQVKDKEALNKGEALELINKTVNLAFVNKLYRK